MNAVVKFAKLKENAIIPSKRDEDMGFDIYACFDEDYIKINYNETKLIPTGIASACDHEYGFLLRERGSTGSKGIALRAGVIDSGYRNEWFVGLTNTTDKVIFISKIDANEIYQREYPEGLHFNTCDGDYKLSVDDYEKVIMIYPYEKAIAQALIIPVPKTTIEEVSYDELKNITSERGFGALGSSGK